MAAARQQVDGTAACLWAAWCGWGVCLASIFSWVQAAVPQPYMDEIFHVPQAQQYCEGRYHVWDPKITTFPGLYLASVPYAQALRWLQRAVGAVDREQMCTTATLRSINTLLAAVLLLLAYVAHQRLHPAASKLQSAATAAMAALIPPLFFFSFLYYTDTGGAVLVLAALLASLYRQYHISALLSAGAVLFRQTNAVWAVFILGSGVVRKLLDCERGKTRAPSGPLPQLAWLLCEAWQKLPELALCFSSTAAVPLAFTCFTVVNGGIVVGDRSAHVPVHHFAQLNYLAGFCVAALAPVHLSPAWLRHGLLAPAMRSFRNRPAASLAAAALLLAAAAGAAAAAPPPHPYLLADNRHYMFYLWKNLLRRPAVQAGLIPAACFCWVSLGRHVLQAQPPAIALGLLAASALAVVPAWLLELRYFLIPFLLLILHMPPPTLLQAAAAGAAYATVNAATLYLFVARPFRWPDGSEARFMW